MAKRATRGSNDSQLLAALKGVSPLMRPEGSILQQHVLLKDHWAVAYDGMMAIGEPIIEDLFCAPNALMLRNALANCGQQFSISQNQHTLSVHSGKFKAIIPCISPNDIGSTSPDPVCARIDDVFKLSMAAIAPIAIDETNVVKASILVDKGSITSTDGKIIIQHWHGIDLPPRLVLPKSLIGPVVKSGVSLSGFGFSGRSATLHFENRSWIKTAYFAEDWPDIDRILNQPCSAHPVPEDLFTAIKALESFSETGWVYSDSNMLRSHEGNGKGATHDVYGMPANVALNIKQMKIIEPLIKTVDFLVEGHNSKMMLWFGDKVRGAVAGRR